ncbi:alpha/beta fold hydrolase [Streptomyces sp. H39-S7]|uniref:alpha/beta fold hydrolase n=1 Tax=Streptomyces sp. H39-S7 TaxID=3004357 RepID=UPI0022AFD60E|nr:alpha/beta hydrolase [Streptomyces sp. H39-S7]MCZ4120450.1 alpha/beta hydrolase [Streptomyces sp. H39-S7]
MRQTEFGPAAPGAAGPARGRRPFIRWTEAAGTGPARVYLHGLGSASGPYFAHVAADPALAGRRSLFVDLPGFGISDRPADFGYSLEEHADAVAAALDAAGVRGAEVVGHSMGGAVAIVLAHRRPDLVAGLVLVEANLDPNPPVGAGSSGIAAYEEREFVEGGGFAAVLERVGPLWGATMRLADPVALYRSAGRLARGSEPTMRTMLLAMDIPRTFLVGELSTDVVGRAELVAAGVGVETVPGAGHNIMFDNPGAFAALVAAAGPVRADSPA